MTSRRRLVITRRAQRDLEVLDAPQRVAILAAIAAFVRGEVNIRICRLQDSDPPRFRLRVGDYRVLIALEPRTLVVERVLHRREAYR